MESIEDTYEDDDSVDLESERDFIRKAVVARLNAAWLARSRIKAFHFVTQGLQESRRYAYEADRASLHRSIESIHDKLYREEAEALRDLMLFCFMSKDEKLIGELAELTRQTYFKADGHIQSAIMHYLEDDMRMTPSRWLSDDDKDFMSQIQGAFDNLIVKVEEKKEEEPSPEGDS